MKRFIGDAVMSAPLLNALEPDYKPLHVICTPVVAQVLENPDEDRKFLPLDTKRKPWEVVQSALSLRRQSFGIAVLINHSFRSAVTIRLAGIPRRIGHATEGRNWLLTDAVPYDEDVYEAWSELDLAKPLGLEPKRVTPKLPLRNSERELGRKLVGKATVGIQPGARFAAKMLPLQSIALVARELQEQGHEVAFLGAKEESEAAQGLAKELIRPPINLVGVSDIRGSLGALANLKVMIGADTGLMHLAAAIGTPTVTIFGPTPAQKWGHYYGPHQVLKAPDGDMAKLDPHLILEAAQNALK